MNIRIKNKILTLIESELDELIFGFRFGEGYCFRIRRKPIMDCSDKEAVRKVIESDRQSVYLAKETWRNSYGKEASDLTFRRFFCITPRYRHIRKRPRGTPSPLFDAYKTEKRHELNNLYAEGKISLFYADESHVCIEDYAPHGWQFSGEDVYVPSESAKRLNIFGMNICNNHFESFCTSESIDVQKVANSLEQYSFRIIKKRLFCLTIQAKDPRDASYIGEAGAFTFLYSILFASSEYC